MVTEKNTKKEIMEAYRKNLKDLKELRAANQSSADRGKAVVQSKVESSEGLSSGYVESYFEELRQGVESGRKMLADLNTAIDAKRAELKILHDVSVEAETLEAMVATHEETKRKFKEEVEASAAFRNKQITELETRLARETDELEYNFTVKKVKAEKKFARDMEELDYQRQSKHRELDKELQERIDNLVVREEKMDELESQVESFPKEIADAVEAAAFDAEERFKKSKAAAIRSLEKDMAHMKITFESEVKHLEKTIETLEGQNVSLKSDINAATMKISDLAETALNKPPVNYTPNPISFTNGSGKQAN